MRTVGAKCPICGGQLPPVPIKVTWDWREPSITVEMAPTKVWWAQVRLSHPNCVGDRDDLPQPDAA